MFVICRRCVTSISITLRMYRFDTSWFYRISSILYKDFLRLIPAYRERFYLSWVACSVTLVFTLTQVLVFWRHVLTTIGQTNQVIYSYLDTLLLAGLLITWQWGMWYLLRLGLLYWMKERLPLWVNSSMISCGLIAAANCFCLANPAYKLSVGTLPMTHIPWLLVSSFLIGAFLPTLNNQRWPNKCFA